MHFLNQFHSQHTPIRIIHVGAGAAGLLTAFKAQKYLKNFELVCYEKNSGIGGTWFENRYPGCGCDVPAHSYTFSFEPNPDWSSYYVGSEEIHAYMESFCKKYDLDRFICLETTVLGAQWDDDAGEWAIDLQKSDGSKFTDRAHVVINGSGPLNKWKWPDVPNRESFKGVICHASAWDPSIDWADKRVAVIGCGSTGVQVTPELAKGSRSLTLFARTVQWITPPLGMQDLRVPGTEDTPESQAPNTRGKHVYSEAEKRAMRIDPVGFLRYRKGVDQILQRWFGIFIRDSPIHDEAIRVMSSSIRERFGDDKKELADFFIPKFSPGCRRNTPAEGFIEALTQDHVNTVQDEIKSFTETGLVTAGDRTYDFDIIVCATGFDVAYTPHFPVKGLKGKTMKDEWAKNPRIYLTVATPDFPNFFHIGGPTGNWGSGCVLATHEVQADYAIQACLKLSTERLHSVVPKADPTDQYMAFSASWHKEKSAWGEDCKSWYKNGGSADGEVMLWCGSMLHMMKTLKSPRWEDYEIRRRDGEGGKGNMWAFLGGPGRTELEMVSEKGTNVDLSPFVRNGDEPWDVELERNIVMAP
ncbi:cyclohexanone monooxygenase [Biscogniauxia marginata]|nr:cyclohexanone monooxygenase [Biscogniauxia marginata]